VKLYDNFELSHFRWTEVLVEIIEEVARLRSKSKVYIQPALYNVAEGAHYEE
jgi:hypothetical protein